MYYDLNADKSIYLAPEEIEYFTKELPIICHTIIKQYKENTKESLFDLFSKQIKLNRHTNFSVWIRKYKLFLLQLLYIHHYALIRIEPVLLIAV